MDDRGPKPKGFAFTREVRSHHSRRVYPENDEQDEISLNSIEEQPQSNLNSPVNERVVQSYRNDRLVQPNRNLQKQTKVKLTKNDAKSGLSSKCITGSVIAGGVVLGISLVVVLPTVIGIFLTRNPAVTNATTTTTAAPTVNSAYWGFDNNVNDLYGIYNGAIVNGAAYSNNTYFGYGFNLFLNNSVNQSVVVTSPFFNLSYTSFTVEAWIYGISLTGDNAIFSQCQCNSCQDQCLYLIIRNYKMYMGFTLDDIIGSTSLSINTWYHVAYVYDYSSQKQSVYLQGVLDASKTSAGPYLGQNGSLVIGASQLSSSSFNGYIDNLKLTTRAKSATEILADGSVVVYYSFDGTTLTEDMGPNQMNGSLSNAAAVTGKVGQGLAFTGAVSSYLQIYGFYQLGQSNKPFSFAMWLYPYSINGGVLIQKSAFSTSTSGWCYTLMGLNYGGQIVMVVYTGNVPLIVGPVLSVRTWTHLGFTYSSTNGLRMYINGALWGNTPPISWSSSGIIDWLSIGSYVNGYCGVGIIYATPYLGAMDEFYVYRRELNASEVTALANP